MQEYEVGAVPERIWEPARVKGFFILFVHAPTLYLTLHSLTEKVWAPVIHRAGWLWILIPNRERVSIDP